MCTDNCSKEPVFTIECKYCHEPIYLIDGILVIKEGLFHPKDCYPNYMKEMILALEDKIEEQREVNLRRLGAL